MSVLGALVGVVVGLAVLAVLLWYFKRHRPEAKRRAEMRLRAEMGEGNRTRATASVRTRTASSLNPTFARQGEAWVTFSTHPRSIAAVKEIIAELGQLGIPANRCYHQSEIPTDGKSTEVSPTPLLAFPPIQTLGSLQPPLPMPWTPPLQHAPAQGHPR